MIKSIDKLQKFGIFKNFVKNAELSDFNKYNLFYGWNGSGKTTLTKLFLLLEKKDIEVINRFPDCEFKITTDVNIITQNNFSDSDLNIRVFNENFINDNIDWDNVVKSILLISEEKISEMDKLKKLNESLLKNKEEQKKYNEDRMELKTEISSFLTNTARNIKRNFQIIDTKDNYYLNYNKAKLTTFIDNKKNLIINNEAILSEGDIKTLTASVKPEILDEITFPDIKLFVARFKKIEEEIKKILKRNVFSESIERLRTHSDISKWVEEGLSLYKKYNNKTCEFCGQIIPEDRIEKLEKHFNKEFKTFKEQISNTINSLNNEKINIESLPDKDKLYPEFKSKYQTLINEIIDITNKINNSIDEWIFLLEQKYSNPFNTDFQINIIEECLFNDFNSKIQSLHNIILQHNQKTRNFTEETKKQKEKLELHYAAEAIKDFDYFKKVNDVNSIDAKLNELKENITNLENEISNMEKQLSNEALGASKFNEHLHKFIGHSEISLKFDIEEKGYRILRHGEPATNLSEGEKTAIAFIYFITKLKENNNKIEDTIIIIDDPVSSFDSNHLFNAYSFLKAECEGAKQLFIFTHSFNFYRLIRDWLIKKNKKGRSIKSEFFVIEIKINDSRESVIANADETLKKYNSEYHYLFCKLYEFKDKLKLKVDEAFLIANMARKILESFLSFKFPKARNDFAQLLEVAIPDDVHKREKIYRFINKYSHISSIGLYDTVTDNLLGEGHNIVNDVFNIIEELDTTHYEEMIKLIE